MKKYMLAFGLATTVLSTPAMAEDSLEDALHASDVYVKGRYRFEHVDSNAPGITNDANASTLRTAFGAKTGDYKGFRAAIEYEDISQIGNDLYNDTINGKVNRPVVADPEDDTINLLYLEYVGVPDTEVILGRQIIELDNQRFVGSVAWRQNDQTFDSLRIDNNSIEDTEITYAYSYRVNRIFGTESPNRDFRGNVNLFNVSNNSLDFGKITGYYYSLDFDDSPVFSSRTIGASFVGSTPLEEGLKLNYHLEYARQSDIGSNTNNYDADYIRIAPGLSFRGLTVTGIYELLGADGTGGGVEFETPLATGHKFNGFADLFLNTPAGGLEDVYLDVTYKFSGLSGDIDFLNGLLLKAQYHDFSSDEGGVDFGQEFDFYAKLPIADNYYAELKYADFNADAGGGFSDTQRVTFGFGFNFNLTE